MNVRHRLAARTNCLVCRTAGVSWMVAGDREMLRCPACRFTWVAQGVKRTAHGRSIYDDATPVFLDPAQADYYRDDTAVDAARAKLQWVRSHTTTGALLDVGANFGLFAREAAHAFDTVGIEPSHTTVDIARREFHAPLEQGSIDEYEERFDSRFDVVTLFDVIEHVADPAAALRHCRRYLRAGGHLFITTPDTSSLMARLLGRHWYYVDIDEHVSLFDRRNLGMLLDGAGFRTVEQRTIGRSYRISYIERRLGYLARRTPMLRPAHALMRPLRRWPSATLRLNFGDVMGIVAQPG